jgi:uncharacterized membrane protein YbaN (DUF454 family)
MKRSIFLSLGFFMVALGMIGVVVPLIPTTIFLIAAAACFARSSPRFEAWLLDHPRFGPIVQDWRAHGAISRPAKIMACAGMAAGFFVFWIGTHPSAILATVVAGLLLTSAAYVVSRPTIDRR